MGDSNNKSQKTLIAKGVEQAFAENTTMDWFEILRTGTHTPKVGDPLVVDKAMLDSIVANFSKNRVAFVFGHPQENHPSFGWGGEARVEPVADSAEFALEITGEHVQLAFANAVASRRYPNRSISLLSDGRGGMVANHVGFLGAVPPAVEGLNHAFQFSSAEDKANLIVFEFSLEQRTARTLVSLMRGLRDFFIEEKGVEKADEMFNEWDIDWLQRETVRDEIENEDNHEFSTHKNGVKIVADKDKDKKGAGFGGNAVEFSALQAENSALKMRLGKVEFSQSKDSNQALVDVVIKRGALTVAQSEGLTEFMTALQLSDSSAVTFEFSRAGTAESDKNKQANVKSSLHEFAAAFLEGLPVTNNLSGDIKDSLANTSRDFSANVDQDSQDMDAKAVEFQKANNCSYEFAVAAVEEDV